MLNSLAEKYAKSTIKHIRVLFNQAYKAAKKDNDQIVNPLPTHNSRQKLLNVRWKPSHRKNKQLLRQIYTYSIWWMNLHFEIYLLTGLRRDELRLMMWKDWNQKQNTITVRNSKTKKGIRKIPLSPEVRGMLGILYLQADHRPEDCIISLRNGDPVCKTHFPICLQ